MGKRAIDRRVLETVVSTEIVSAESAIADRLKQMYPKSSELNMIEVIKDSMDDAQMIHAVFRAKLGRAILAKYNNGFNIRLLSTWTDAVQEITKHSYIDTRLAFNIMNGLLSKVEEAIENEETQK